MNVRRTLAVILFAAAFLGFVAPGPAVAQDNAAMTGTVTDTTGAVIPGATVTLTNPSKGDKFTQVADSKGSYRFANVPPNKGYTATFSQPGFANVTFSNLTLAVGITRTQDAQLQAGTAQSVEVSAANAEVTINTTDASIGNNFDVKLLNELPIQNRDSPAALFTLQPGYANGSFVGARTDQNSVTIDGIDVNDIASGAGITNSGATTGGAPVDSVQEFRGTITGLVPSLGTGSGAQFQLVTKSGTNQFHGNINEYHRDTSTVANSWFNNNSGVPRTPLIRNQFGGNLGGPILRDKLFFFFDFNNSRIVQSGTTERVVPLDSFRNGNLNYILARDASGNLCGAGSTVVSTPQCIGTLTSAQVAALDPQHIGFDPSLLAFINTRYPHVNDPTYNGGDGVNTGGFRFTQPTPDTLYNYVGKVDFHLTPTQTIFVRASVAREDSVQALNNFPTDPLTNPFQNRSYGYVVSHTWQLGQNKVNQFYYGDNISKVNFANLYNPTGALQFGFGGLSAPYSSGSSQKRRVPIPELRDDFNWTLGGHNLSFGGTFKFIKTNSNLVNDFSGVAIGLGGFTNNLNSTLRPTNIRGGVTAPTDYDRAFTLALGRIGSIGSNYNYTAQGAVIPQGSGETRNYRFYQTELYLGDTWKVNKQFTVSYGVRYQLYSVPYEVHGAEAVQNLTFNQLIAARIKNNATGVSGDNVVPFVTYNLGGKTNGGAPLYNPSYKDFAPRVAFAYSPSFAPKSVFNASAALLYDRTVINAVNFIQDQSSFLFQNSVSKNYGQTSANAALLADPRLGANFSLGSAAIPTAPAIGKPYTPYVAGTSPIGGPDGDGYAEIIDPNLKDPYTLAFNAGVQQELPGHFVLKINYAGRLGRRLLAQADAAQVLDYVDPKSGQKFSTAFGNVTQQLRSGVAATAVTPQPWFENVIPSGTGRASGSANNTVFAVSNDATQVQLGDIADFANFLSENGLIDTNVAVGAQFALNPWVTNKGFSTYNGLLVTLTKNLSQGVQFDVNYTWSHSMDNVSAPANYIAANALVNFICDVTQPRACRGNSDFDVENVINSDFIADLPVGHGKRYLGNSNRLVDELVGGWSISGTPQWRSGFALGTVSNAFSASFNEDAPGIFVGNRANVQAKVHKTSQGVQLFPDQTTAAASFVGPVGLGFGSRNNLRGPSAFNMDAGLAKAFPIIGDRVSMKFRADFFNVLNHPAFGLPNNDFTSGTFGIISATSNSARVGQFSLRLEF